MLADEEITNNKLLISFSPAWPDSNQDYAVFSLP
jgi:hypothetical protein